MTSIKELKNKTLIILIAAAALLALACGTSSPPVQPSPVATVAPPETPVSPTPTPIPTATPTATEPPAEPEFEATIEGDDLAKFQGLPAEFQDALNHVAETPQHPQSPFTSYEEALEFLRGLPADVQPISEVLPSETLDVFNELSDKNRGFLLLDVYSRTFGGDEFFAESPESERQALREGLFENIVKQVHKMEFGDGEVDLPPMAEALSAEALGKLDEIDPLIRRAFLLIWRNTRMPQQQRDVFVTKLQRALLDVPTELPPVGELGLSQEALKMLEDVPNLRTFVEEYVAADLASTGAWDAVGTEYSGAMFLESLIVRASTPEGSRMFAKGLLPVMTYQPPPLISHYRPVWGFWPLWAIPSFFLDMQPDEFVAEWPDHELVLSQEALAKLDSLDAPLQEAFEKYWYGTGPLPNEVHWMAGIVIRWERDLRTLPFDTLPEVEELLSAEDLAVYRRLDPSSRNVVTSQIAYDVLYGRTWLKDIQKTVYAYDTTPDEFLDALETSVSATVRDAAARFASNR